MDHSESVTVFEEQKIFDELDFLNPNDNIESLITSA